MAPIKASKQPRGLGADAAIGVVQNREQAAATRYHDVSNMTEELRTVKYQVPAAAEPDETVDEVEQIRRRFAAAWGQMGAAWGVPPSTAMVQGYMLVHGGPVTDKELQDALGLSHRAIRLALEDCEEWGIVRRASEPRRSGRRGPAGRAWLALDDHWEWFRRVIEARKEREGDPVIAILEQCLVEASRAPKGEDSADLRRRLEIAARLRWPVRSRTLGRRPRPHRSFAQAVQGAVSAGREVTRSTAQLAGRHSGRRAGIGRQPRSPRCLQAPFGG